MASRQNFSSGAVWEGKIGYSRLVKSGNMIWVSGTVAVDEDGDVVGKDDAYAQSVYIIQKIDRYLQMAGASLKDVVRTRIFTTHIALWEEIGQAHGEFFKDIRPATSMVEVKGLIHPDYMVEIEAEARIG